MQKRLITLGATFIFLFLSHCGPATSRYPSYKRAIAKYAPQGEYEAVRADGRIQCPPSPYCDCPRIWYYDHWIYYYGYHWMYWHYGHWYYYPHIYVYYHGGIPHVYRRPTLNITTRAPKGTRGPAGGYERAVKSRQTIDRHRFDDRYPTGEPRRPAPRSPSGTHMRSKQPAPSPVKSSPPPQKAPAPPPKRTQKQP